MSHESMAAVYQPYDDAALALLANPGLVRRAAKILAAGDVSGSQADGVTVGEIVVQLGAGGPASSRCPCPATGVCVHILAASMWLRGIAHTAGAGPAGDDLLTVLLDTDTLALCREAGIAAVRRTRAYLSSLDPSLPPTVARVDSGRIVITVGEQHSPIYFLPGAGLGGMVSDTPADHKPVVHLAALVRVFAASEREWVWPATATDAVAASFESVHGHTIELLRAALAAVLTAGLSHAVPDDSERLSAIAVRARAEGLPLLARVTNAAAVLLANLADRRDETSEREVALALAQAWALAAALAVAPPEQRQALTGTVRREFSEAAALELVPLGALWWTNASARGVTLVVADRASGDVELVSTARPAGTDPGFRQSDHAPLIWSSSIASITSAPFRLEKPRRAPDGSLSGGGGETRFTRAGGVAFDAAELRSLAVAHWPDGALAAAASAGFGRQDARAVLLAPAAVGDIRIDEAAQQLVWPLVDATDNVIEARVDVGPTTTRRIEALLSIAASRARVEFVLVHTGRRSGARTIEPSGVFVSVKGGMALIVPDFVRPEVKKVAEKRTQALRARFERMLAAPRETLVASTPASLAERLCLPVLDVLEEICATGRLTITERQRGILSRQAALASDIALATVEAAIHPLLAETPVTAPAVYRCLFVVDRAMAVTG